MACSVLQLLLLGTFVATTTIQSTMGTRCTNAIPGVSLMFKGVDITTLDLVPINFVANRGIKNTVLNFTCNIGEMWTSSSGEQYQRPDQIWHITPTHGGWLSANVKVFKSSDDVRRWMNMNVGASGSIFDFFSFSASHSYKNMQHAITNTSKYVEEVSAFKSATTVGLIPDFILRLGRFAQIYVDRFLTGTFESNREAYQRFINTFGTHYFSNANFGGIIKMNMQTDKSYVHSKTDEEIENDAKASFFRLISAHGETVSGSTTVSTSFRRVTSIETRYYGGDVTLLTSNGIQQWQSTVDRHPWLFSGQLVPISNLIMDNGKKANMVKAVKEHVMRSYLDELSRMVQAAKNKVSSPTWNTLETRIAQLKSTTTLVENDVRNLDRAVKYHVIVPSWFTTNTKLCYKWRPDGDGGQCGGGAARLLCSAPNSRTPVYRDDTDGRGGGCRMQWSIQSVSSPSWFSNVRVCYRWYPDGDRGQCGGGAARLLCSSLNSYTPEYRDDSDGRSGGCRMSWKLEVPSTAPVWMKTASICYYWYPDGNGGQCGPAASRTLCASNNEWTSYYRDDTDGRSGGCRMSWAINVSL